VAGNLTGPAPVWQNNFERTLLKYDLRTVTPMFGGGAVAGEIADPPIRAALIRGHLRFWWRATAGIAFQSAAELHNAEKKLWGDMEHPGTVVVRVNVTNASGPIRCGNYTRGAKDRLRLEYVDKNYPPYALFPFQGSTEKGAVKEEPSFCIESVEFEIRIECLPNDLHAIKNAIAAWVTFGGVGARTRRGCGSVACAGVQVPAGGPVSSRTLLTGIPVTYYVHEPVANAVSAWESAVNAYRDFRQGVPFARNKGQNDNVPGRSLWPEPDSIRRITDTWDTNHNPYTMPERGFPRADLGLPIIFHFQSKTDPQNDPTLQGRQAGMTRFASPVITKALAVQNGRFVPMIAILSSPRVWENGNLELKYGVTSESVSREEVEVVGKPMSNLNQSDIREALVAFISDKGFKEVKL